MPGQHATVAIAATETLEPAGDAFRVALPATIAALGPQARVVDQAGGATLVVIPPEGASGIVTVTLAARVRSVPNGSPRPHAPGVALVVPLQDAERSAIATTIVELEIAAPNEVRWMTLVHHAASAASLWPAAPSEARMSLRLPHRVHSTRRVRGTDRARAAAGDGTRGHRYRSASGRCRRTSSSNAPKPASTPCR